MPRDIVGVHTELAQRTVPSVEGAGDYDQTQMLRAVYRPVLDSEGDRYALASAETDDESLGLRLREDARWHDGTRVTAADLKDAILAGLDRSPGLAGLLGIRGDAVQEEGPHRLRVWSRAAPLVADVLTDLRFTPWKRGYTGAFEAGADGVYRPRSGRGRSLCAVHLESTRAAIAAFDRGLVAATCPAMFELAQHADSRRTKDCVTNMVAKLIVNPRLDPVLASAPFRAALSRGLAVPDAARDTLVVERACTGPVREVPQPAARTLRVVYGGYWPNQFVASAVASVLAELGVRHMILISATLPELTNRLRSHEFDLAIAIDVGTWGRHSQLLRGAASIHHRASKAARSAMEHATRELARGSAQAEELLSRMVFDVLPLVPLFRFRSVYLAADALGGRLANDNYLRLEKLASE